MPIYEYKAFASGGSVATGVIDADTPRAARDKLRKEKILVTELRQVKGGRKAKGGRGLPSVGLSGLMEKLQSLRQEPSGPSGRDLEVVAGITRQLGTLLGSGIPAEIVTLPQRAFQVFLRLTHVKGVYARWLGSIVAA